MIITALGCLLIPVGLVLFLIKPKYLLYGVIMFCGFTGSSVMTLGVSGVSIQPAYYLAILWMIYRCLKKRSFRMGKSVFEQNKWLCIFMMLASLSIIMPMILPSDITVINIDGNIDSLSFSSANITQLAYLWFCFLFYIFVVDFLSINIVEQQNTVRHFTMGVFLVLIVTVYQIFAFNIGLPFDELFRQNIHGNIQGNRIYGPCIEASMLCYYLISALPICVRFKNRRNGLIITLLAMVLGIYSFSSTFFVGVILWILCEFISGLLEKKIKIKKSNIYLFLNILLVIAILCFVFRGYLNIMIYKFLDTIRAKNHSGIERSTYFVLLIKAFMYSPIFGIGFGSCRGTDLFSTWLSALGVVGITPICIHMFSLLQKGNYNKGVRHANIIVWVLMLASVPEPYNLFVWILMAYLAVWKEKEDNVVLALGKG